MTRRSTVLLLLAAALLATGCRSLLLRVGYPEYAGEVSNLPLEASVEILRDRWGIPHIYAAHEEDLLTALGFVHAQDRLWQMETFRLITEGRLSEIAGEDTLMLDYLMRLLDMAGFKRRMSAALSPQARRLLEAYVGGVNAFIDARRGDLPLEFRTLDLEPRPWRVVDCMSVPALIAWYMQANYNEELLAILRGREIPRAEWDLLFASHPGASLPEDGYFEDLRQLLIAPLHPAALALLDLVPEPYDDSWRSLLAGLSQQTGGSNNWAVARGADGLPILANDPHLGITVPGFWYLCHLELGSPQAPVRVAGATVPGLPAIPVGRNAQVAWGVTNVMLDNADLFVLRIDPEHPTRYAVAGEELEMSREILSFGLPKGARVELPMYRTIYGPVITQVVSGVDAVVSLKWYGALPEGAPGDTTSTSILALARAESAAEVMDLLSGVKILAFNFLAADAQGSIAWHATGAAPVRSGYSGRLPADGSSGAMDWRGFLPYERLPQRLDPQSGWLATANHRIAGRDETAAALSYSWAAPYRYERIADFLEHNPRPSVEDFRRLQTDDYCLLADRVIPRLHTYATRFRDDRALRAMRLIEAWDRRVSAASAGAALFEVFLSEWLRLTLDELGSDLPVYFNGSIAGYSLEDVLLEHPGSSLWDRAATPEWETPEEILEEALVRAFDCLETRQGADPAKWSWGRLHRYLFRHSGATNRLTAWLLNRGPYPAPGDGNTVNPGYFSGFPGVYDVFWISSLRMVAPLGDLDGTVIVAPLGQSGQPGHPHYDDMIEPWLEGRCVPLPMSRSAVEAAAVQRLVLRP